MKSRARHRVAPEVPRPARGGVVALCTYALWTAIALGGQGGGTPAVMFEPAVGSDMGESGPQDIERADFNRDGWPDVAILTTGNGRQIQFLDSTAAGALAKGPTLNVPFGSGFASGYFDSDGLLDLAVTQIAMNSSDSNPLCGTGAVPGTLIYRGTTGSRFTFQSCLPGVARSVGIRDVVTGDFNGDTYVDLVVVGDPGYRALKFYPGHGDGTFGSPVQVVSSTGAAYTALNPAPDVNGPMTVLDVDRDGDLDIIARAGSSVGTFLNFNGLGQFRYFITTVPTGSAGAIRTFAVGDLNRDGVSDIAGAGNGGVFVATGAGVVGSNPTYTLAANVAMPAGATYSLLADLNKDGALDLAVVRDAATGSDDVYVFAGNGDGTLVVAPTIAPIGLVFPPANPRHATVGDWNRDNWLDLAVADGVLDNPRVWALRQIPGVADEIPPSVTITAPAAGGPPLSGSVTLMADATDNSGVVSRVEFYSTTAGPTPVTTRIAEDPTWPWAAVWNTVPRPNGNYTLTAKAFDAAGNSSVSPGVVVTTANADTTAPVVSVTASAAKSWLAAPTPGQVALNATASDLNGVTSVEFYAQPVGGALTLIGVDATPPFGGVWNTGEDANGNGVLDPAEDTNGNGILDPGEDVNGNGVLDPSEDVNLNGALDAILATAGSYSLTARAYDAANNAGTSPPVVVEVNRPPRADAGPDRSIAPAADGSATITGTGIDPDPGDELLYQWFEGDVPLGPVAATPSLSVVLPHETPYFLELRITDSHGAFSVDVAEIMVDPSLGLAPGVATHPASQVIASGSSATLSVVATGTAPLSYQWYQGLSPGTTSPISGAATSSYVTPALITAQRYWVRVTNALGTADSATATVTVNSVPSALGDAYTATEDTVLTVAAPGVLANDTDADTGTTLTAVLATGPASGILALSANGGFTYLPNPNFAGTDTFAYRADDGSLSSSVTTVTIMVPASNDAPVATDDTVTTDEDTAVTIAAAALLGNDADPDGDALTIASVTSGAGGTAVLNADGSVFFTPALDFTGAARFSYTATDGGLASNAATVIVTVAAVNDAPAAVDDTAMTAEDTAVTIAAATLLANDADPDGDVLTIASVTGGVGGSVVLNADGSVTFAPAANFTGAAKFTYTASDGSVPSNLATVTVTVTAVNDAPAAVDDTVTTDEDTAVTIVPATLLGNDTDPDGDALTIASVTSGAGGTTVLNADGTVLFTPTANFTGAARFSYTATDGGLASNAATVIVTVAAVNDAPAAVDDTATTAEDTAVTIAAATLLANDTDPDGDALTIASVTSGAGGTTVLNADGSVFFTPAANFTGAATFTYTATDGSVASNAATVTVTVAAVNDAPVAVDDTTTTDEDTAVTIDAAALLGNDTDPDGDALTIASVTGGVGGSVVLNADGTVRFTPALNFTGAANFTYTASDGSVPSNPATVMVTVTTVNDAPAAVDDTETTAEDTAVTIAAATLLANDTDPDDDALTIASVTSGAGGSVVLNADGSVTFAPAANFTGAAKFTYTASDGSVPSNPATVTVTVSAVNDAPAAVDDTATTDEDTAITIAAATLLGNDTDPDGDALTIASVTSGADGTTVLNADGTVLFTPTANFTGAANFTYTASDGRVASNAATVIVTVAAVNDAPAAVDDTAPTAEDTAVIITAATLLANDTYPDGDALTIASVTGGVDGSVVLNADGSVTFTPAVNFAGAASFSYTATDGNLVSNAATVIVTVAAVNDAPVALDDVLTATANTAVTYPTVTLLANDTDIDSASLTVGSVTSGIGGTVVRNADGSITFAPALNFAGAARFTYEATDGTLSSRPATVTVDVTAPPAITTEPVSQTIAASTTATLSVVATGTAPLTYQWFQGTSPSTTTPVAGAATSSYTTPALTITTSYWVRVTNGYGTANSATATITIASGVAPAITSAPASQTIASGTIAALSVAATGTAPLAYQWYRGTSPGTTIPIAGATTSSYTTPPLTSTTSYWVRVTNAYGTANSVTATITMTAGGTNHNPIANPDAITVLMNSKTTPIPVLANDSTAPDVGEKLTVTAVTQSVNGGTVARITTGLSAGKVSYKPKANFVGTDTFTYTISDGRGGTGTATVTVTVASSGGSES